MKISIDELRDLTTKAIASFVITKGRPRRSAKFFCTPNCAETIRGGETDRQGDSRDPAAGEIVIEKETPLSTRINGNRNHAMVVVRKALEIVAAKAEKSGFGIAGPSTPTLLRRHWLRRLRTGPERVHRFRVRQVAGTGGHAWLL